MKYQAPYGSSDPDAPYVDRNTPGAVAGSKVPAAAIEDPQREIDSAIALSGLTPSETDLRQLARAVRSLGLNFAIAGGTANALTVTLNPVPAAYTELRALIVAAVANNTGPATLNVNGLGAQPIVRADGSSLQAADIVIGQLLFLFRAGASWQIAGLNTAAIGLQDTQMFLASGTFTPPAGVYKVRRVRVWGGGGGGGYAANTNDGVGGGASSGTYSEDYDLPCTPGVGIAVTVGAGGAAGASGVGGGIGGNAGASSFGAFTTAPGGLGGGVGATATPNGAGAAAPLAGSVTNGFSLPGGRGFTGTFAVPLSGNGGSSPFGGGGGNPASAAAGDGGQLPGGGGSGGGKSAVGRNGGTGAAGLVIVEY